LQSNGRAKYWRIDSPDQPGEFIFITLQPETEHVALIHACDEHGTVMDLDINRFSLIYKRVVIENVNEGNQNQYRETIEERRPIGGFLMLHWEYGGILRCLHTNGEWRDLLKFTTIRSVNVVGGMGGLQSNAYNPTTRTIVTVDPGDLGNQ